MQTLDRFRTDFTRAMASIRSNLTELEKAGALLRRQVGEFCAR